MTDLVIGTVPVISLIRKRGDTKSIDMTLSDSDGTAINITGYSFILTVNSEEEPLDDTNQIFTVNGTLIDAPNGKVAFGINSSAADNVGEFFYDIQLADVGGETFTYLEGTFLMTQDITKG